MKPPIVLSATFQVHVMNSRRTVRRIVNAVSLGLVMGAIGGCHGLLDVNDPTLIQNKDIENAEAADAWRQTAVSIFANKLPRALADVAVFTDEITYDRNILQNLLFDPLLPLDRRDGVAYEAVGQRTSNDPHIEALTSIVTSTSNAIYSIRAYTPDSLKGDFLAQMFALRGFAVLQMAEDLCPGFPINDVTADRGTYYSLPFTTDSATEFAVTQIDSALTHGRDSIQTINLARVLKGRALLDLGRYGAAAAAVTAVPDAFEYKADTTGTIGNAIAEGGYFRWNFNPGAAANREGGVGLPFVSSHDPRTPTRFKRTRISIRTDSLYEQLKYVDRYAATVLASGVEARLIEAEAALNADDEAWLTTLNALRTDGTFTTQPNASNPVMTDTLWNAGTGGVTGLGPLSDPGSNDARVDLLYRERAAWLYLTGRRLGDIRRLMRNYGRTATTLLPQGAYPLGGEYGSDTAIPFNFTIASTYNTNITHGCTTR